MNNRLLVVLPLIALLSMSAQDPKPETGGKYHFASGVKAGDRFLVKTAFLLDVDIALTDVTAKKNAETSRFVRNEEFAIEILTTGEGGPETVKVQCLRSTVEADISAEAKTSLDGQTLTLRKGANGFQPDPETPNISKKDLGFLENLGFCRQFLPPADAAPGDQWKVKPTGLLSLVCGGVKGAATDETLTCSLAAVNGDVAEIALAYDAKSAHGEKSLSEAKLNGSFRFNVALGRPVSLALSGSVGNATTILRKEEGTGKVDEVGTLTVNSKKLEITVEFAPAPTPAEEKKAGE